MNGIEKITGKIEEEAQIFEKALMDNYAADAAEMVDSYKSKSDFVIAAANAKTKKIFDDAIARAVSSSELIARNSILAMKSELIADAFRASEKRIAGLKDEDYLAFLKAVAAKACNAGEGEVMMNPSDTKRIGKKFVDELNSEAKAAKKDSKFVLSEHTVAINGGFILKYGDIENNCSIEKLINAIRPKVESMVITALFPTKK